MDTENNSAEYDGHCAFAVSTGKTDVKGGKHSSIFIWKNLSFFKSNC